MNLILLALVPACFALNPVIGRALVDVFGPASLSIVRWALSALVDEATGELERYEYARALAKVEDFFWDFCDNYVEAAKARRYGDFGAGPAASAASSSCARAPRRRGSARYRRLSSTSRG